MGLDRLVDKLPKRCGVVNALVNENVEGIVVCVDVTGKQQRWIRSLLNTRA